MNRVRPCLSIYDSSTWIPITLKCSSSLFILNTSSVFGTVAKASTVFGSGWCYLAVNADKTVSINQYSNAANPVKDGGFPLLCVDTWEHAWYIDYENRKVEYFNKFWDAVNWNFLDQRIKEANL